MKRILAGLILALSLIGLCACGKTETAYERAARRAEEAEQALAQSRKAYKQAEQDLNDFKSAWADYQNKKNALGLD